MPILRIIYKSRDRLSGNKKRVETTFLCQKSKMLDSLLTQKQLNVENWKLDSTSVQMKVLCVPGLGEFSDMTAIVQPRKRKNWTTLTWFILVSTYTTTLKIACP